MNKFNYSCLEWTYFLLGDEFLHWKSKIRIFSNKDVFGLNAIEGKTAQKSIGFSSKMSSRNGNVCRQASLFKNAIFKTGSSEKRRIKNSYALNNQGYMDRAMDNNLIFP